MYLLKETLILTVATSTIGRFYILLTLYNVRCFVSCHFSWCYPHSHCYYYPKIPGGLESRKNRCVKVLACNTAVLFFWQYEFK